MSGKGDARRPERDPGAYQRHYDQIEWPNRGIDLGCHVKKDPTFYPKLMKSLVGKEET